MNPKALAIQWWRVKSAKEGEVRWGWEKEGVGTKVGGKKVCRKLAGGVKSVEDRKVQRRRDGRTGWEVRGVRERGIT